MHSEILRANGLLSFIGGSSYNFRVVNVGETLIKDYKKILKKQV